MLFCNEYDLIDAHSATFLALPVLSAALSDAPDCIRKTCCKKYKKGKRCKSCPKR
jgi:hypothetical protein